MTSKISKNKTKKKEIEDILESDDELPTDYVDTVFVPAYQIDDRFETVEVDWMRAIRIEKALQAKPTAYKKPSQSHEDSMMKKGVLNKKDLFISKCIEMSDDTILLWFVNFLMMKDMQSRYSCPRSCLVPSIQNSPYSNNNDCNIEYEPKRRYRIVVKM